MSNSAAVNISVYPDPVSGTGFFVKAPDGGHISIFDATGRLVKRGEAAVRQLLLRWLLHPEYISCGLSAKDKLFTGRSLRPTRTADNTSTRKKPRRLLDLISYF
jgi:hypothetical protein